MRFRNIGLLLALATCCGCTAERQSNESLTLATTTSARDSGLLDRLLPQFRQAAGIDVKVVAVGSGQALELGGRGDADVVLTHAPDAEREFVSEGHAHRRQIVMKNDFLLVGPAVDPAAVGLAAGVGSAMRLIAERGGKFVSRGDNSGTHLREQQMWREMAVAAEGDWYVVSGSGMAQTLRIASELGAYTLSDRSTFLAQQETLDLEILIQHDPALVNTYSVMVVSPARHPHVKHRAAERFVEFLLSPAIQATISKFGTKRYGVPLFMPAAAELTSAVKGEDVE